MFKGRTGSKLAKKTKKKVNRLTTGRTVAAGCPIDGHLRHKNTIDSALNALQMVAVSDDVKIETRRELMRVNALLNKLFVNEQ